MLMPGNYMTERDIEKLYQGVKNKNFKSWMKVSGKHYLPIGSHWGVEKDRNNLYFINMQKNKKTGIAKFEYATLDGIEYFLRVKMNEEDEQDVFIPIR